MILPTYNRSFIIGNFINSLLNQTYKDWELVIVDDSSEDNTFEVLSKFIAEDSRIHYHRLEKHVGLPVARNRGLSLSKGNLLFFGEDDVVFTEENGLEVLIETFFRLQRLYKNRVGAVGSRLVGSGYLSLNSVVTLGPISGWIYHNFNYNSKEVIEVPILHACSLILKSACQEIGGYEEKLYTGTHAKEEVDLYYRLRRKNYKVFFQPQSVLFHDHKNVGGCRKKSIYRVYFYEIRNSLLFFTRFDGFPVSLRVLLYFPLRAALRRKVL